MIGERLAALKLAIDAVQFTGFKKNGAIARDCPILLEGVGPKINFSASNPFILFPNLLSVFG